MPSKLRVLARRVRHHPAVVRVAAPLVPRGILFFHQGRCRSTVLERLLKQHPQLRTFEEIFERPFQKGELPAPPRHMLRDCRVGAAPARAVVETKFFECQHLALLDCSIEDFVDWVQATGYAHYIVLNRRNYLHNVVSAAVGRARGGRGNWHFRVGEAVPKTTVRIDVEAAVIQGKTAPLLEIFDYIDEQYARLRQRLNGEHVLELSYEDDIRDDPRQAYDKVCAWLGLRRVPAEPTLTRASAAPASEAVENWDEIAATLRGTQHEWMLQ